MTIEEKTVEILKALSHPVRLKIVKIISDKPTCVCELMAVSEFTQSNLSQHLKILRTSGIVNFKKSGNKVIYCLADTKILDAIKIIEEMTTVESRCIDV